MDMATKTGEEEEISLAILETGEVEVATLLAIPETGEEILVEIRERDKQEVGISLSSMKVKNPLLRHVVKS